MTAQPSEQRPVVSVVVAAYQVERWIGRFLDSVLDQTLDPSTVELVVVDDGSTDGTGALFDAFAATGRAWSWCTSPTPAGPAVRATPACG